MIAEMHGNRIRLEMSQAEALQMISRLSTLIGHANQSGSGWAAMGIVIENDDGQFAAQLTLAVNRDEVTQS